MFIFLMCAKCKSQEEVKLIVIDIYRLLRYVLDTIDGKHADARQCNHKRSSFLKVPVNFV